MPSSVSLRRADALEVIGTARAAKSTGGGGHLTIATMLGRHLSTVRRWLRRVPETHTQRLYEQAVAHVFRLDPDILTGPNDWPTLFGHGLNILAGAALASRKRVDLEQSPWAVIEQFTRGSVLTHRCAPEKDKTVFCCAQEQTSP